MKDKKVYKFKEDNKVEQFLSNMKCMSNMVHEARIWSMVCNLTDFLNHNEVTYHEFWEIVNIIDHYTHHDAELKQHMDIIQYKHDEGIDSEDEIDEEDFEIDIDNEDGDWFVIPSIG